MRRFAPAFALALCALAPAATPASSQVFIDSGRTVAVETARGADARVDYAGLVRLGPWDDRNYALTAADVALLAPNEAEQADPIPAFFRVAFRKAHPETRREGPAQYPRVAFNAFRIHHGGYLVNGVLYPRSTRVGDRFYVDLHGGIPQEQFAVTGVVTGETRVTSPNGAAESAVKMHPVDPNLVVAGTNGPGGGQQMHWSVDGGATWTQVGLPLGGTCCDPAVDWSSTGQYAYTTTLGQCLFSCGVWFYRSADGGRTWTSLESVTPGDPRREIAASGGDKEYLHVDKSPSSPYKDNLYVTWHQSNVMKFARSTDFGNTWATQTFSSLSEDLGIGSDITTDALGNVYYLWPGFNSRTIRLRKSTNGGQTFGNVVVVATTNDGYDWAIPAMETRRPFVYVSTDADRSNGPYRNSVYAAWNDTYGPEQGTAALNHSRVRVGYSRDGGATWTVVTPHETADFETVDRFNPWLAVDDSGNVFVAFYDTRNDTTRRSVDLYYVRSTDGGQTWSAPARMTTATSPNIADGFEWGDYNGGDAVLADFMAIFTDNRSETGGTGDSVDVYVAGKPGGNAVCGNGIVEAGEACDGGNLNGKTCADFSCSGGALACNASCTGFDLAACTGCTTCNSNGVCDPGESCTTCPSDCVSGTSSGAACGNGVCEAGNGEDCVSCPADCNGNQGGKPNQRYCCGDGGGVNPVTCSDSRCQTGGNTCTSTPVTPGAYCCGDGACSSGESCANCALDCTTGAEVCGNGVDDNCANGADCTDPACASGCCRPVGQACTSNGQCCTGRCSKGTCR